MFKKVADMFKKEADLFKKMADLFKKKADAFKIMADKNCLKMADNKNIECWVVNFLSVLV